MASTQIDPIASALRTLVDSVDGVVAAYKWPPRELDDKPAAVVELPQIERTAPDESEDQLGSNDWHYEFPVNFYFDLTDLDYSHTQAIEVIEAFVIALDADQDLTGTVQEAKVNIGAAEYLEEEGRPTLRWGTTVRVLDFVSPSP